MKNRETIYGELFDEFHKEADKIRRFPQRLKSHCGLEFYGGTKVPRSKPLYSNKPFALEFYRDELDDSVIQPDCQRLSIRRKDDLIHMLHWYGGYNLP